MTTSARISVAAVTLLAAAVVSCTVGNGGFNTDISTSIDPGSNYVVPLEQFNSDYFYCVLEPKLIFDKHCGDGVGVPGAGSGGCHYSDKIPSMALVQHPPVTCSAGNHVVDETQTGADTPAAGNLSAVSLEMSTDYLNAPIYLEPTQTVAGHPVQVFTATDPVVKYIAAWAQQ